MLYAVHLTVMSEVICLIGGLQLQGCRGEPEKESYVWWVKALLYLLAKY